MQAIREEKAELNFSAKVIQALSKCPYEGEILILLDTEFKVKLALTCERARLLNARYAMIPNSVDLVILEAAPPSVPLTSFCRHISPSVVSDPAAMLVQLCALQALHTTASPGQSFAV